MNQENTISEFLNKMNISGFGMPEEFIEEQPEQEILYTWNGGVPDEDE